MLSSMNNPRKSSVFVFILVFLSGCSFLIYEVSWFRMLSLVLGATVKASTIVLVAFMAGFGIGAWFWGRLAGSRFTHRRLLALLLVFTGVSGVMSYFAIQNGLPALYAAMSQVGFSVGQSGLVALLLSLLVLLVPAFFMGGVLPVASGLMIHSNDGLASKVGHIYAWETLGSTLGGLATGFFLIKVFGQQNTVFLSGLLNFISLLPLAFYAAPASSTAADVSADGSANPTPGKDRFKSKESQQNFKLNRYVALLGTFTFGFAAIGLQVAWFRIFRIYMTNTGYTFSLISSIVILGLFAGSRYFASLGAKSHNARTMFNLMLFSSVVIIAGFFLLINLPQWVMFPLVGDQDAYMMRIIVIPIISSLLVILPLTFLSGYAFPLACALYASGPEEVSSSIGRVLFFNTLGTIAGPLLAAFVLIPLLGSGLSVVFFALFLLASAYVLARKLKNTYALAKQRNIALVLGLILLIVLIVSPKVKVLPPSFTRYDREIMEYRESVEGTWVVGREPGGKGAALSTYVNNSAVIGSSYDAIKVVKMVGHLPFFTGLEGKHVLVVGFGIGVTTSAIASHPEVESIDCIELVAGLKDAAHYYAGLNNNIQNDKRLRVIPGDGRHYLQATGIKYDLISSDPTHPILGSGSLYTLEYFELCKSRLNPGGMVSQYLPLHKLLPEDFQGIIKTFHSVFPGATIWLGQSHAVLLGSVEPLKVDFTKWTDRIAATADDPYFYKNPYHLAANLVLDDASIEAFPDNIRLNTDNRPLTEFFRLSAFDTENMVLNLKYLSENRAGVSNVFFNIPDTAMMQRFVAGNRIFAEGVAADLQGNRQALLLKLQEAAQVNPENEEYPFLMKFYGRRQN
jgi:spermidine synthase